LVSLQSWQCLFRSFFLPSGGKIGQQQPVPAMLKQFKYSTKYKTSHPTRERFCLKTLILAFFIVPFFANAQISITEIMYDLSGSDTNEWIEIENTGSQAVDASTWKLFEANSNHGLKVFQGDGVIQPGLFAIIANDPGAFLVEYANFKGMIFDSSFSLLNTGETLIMRDDNLVDSDSATYDSSLGGNGDGNSLHKNASSGWKASAPTPGSGASNSSQQNNQTGGSQKTSSQTIVSSLSSVATESKNSDNDSFSVNIGKDRVAAVGNRLIFTAETRKVSGQIRGASYSWSFGDGSMKNGQSVDYNYRYAGEYVAVVNASRGDEKTVARVNVKVFDPVLEFTVVPSGGIRIENKGKDEINLFEWKIESMGKTFSFPQDTLVKAGSSIIVPNSVSGLTTNEFISLKVYNGLGVPYVHFYIPQKIEAVKPIQPVTQKKEVAEKATENIPQDAEQNFVEKAEGKEVLLSGSQNSASIANAIEIQKPKGMWSRIVGFLRGIF